MNLDVAPAGVVISTFRTWLYGFSNHLFAIVNKRRLKTLTAKKWSAHKIYTTPLTLRIRESIVRHRESSMRVGGNLALEIDEFSRIRTEIIEIFEIVNLSVLIC